MSWIACRSMSGLRTRTSTPAEVLTQPASRRIAVEQRLELLTGILRRQSEQAQTRS